MYGKSGLWTCALLFAKLIIKSLLFIVLRPILSARHNRQPLRPAEIEYIPSARLQLGAAVDDIPPHHHEAVLVAHVVAVDQVSPGEISKLHPELHRILLRERIDVSPRIGRALVRPKRHIYTPLGRKPDVNPSRSLYDPALFKVNVNRVDPIARNDVVLQFPFFTRAFEHHPVYPVLVELQFVDKERLK